MWSTDKYNVTFLIWCFNIVVGVDYIFLKQGTVMIRKLFVNKVSYRRRL